MISDLVLIAALAVILLVSAVKVAELRPDKWRLEKEDQPARGVLTRR